MNNSFISFIGIHFFEIIAYIFFATFVITALIIFFGLLYKKKQENDQHALYKEIFGDTRTI